MALQVYDLSVKSNVNLSTCNIPLGPNVRAESKYNIFRLPGFQIPDFKILFGEYFRYTSGTFFGSNIVPGLFWEYVWRFHDDTVCSHMRPL